MFKVTLLLKRAPSASPEAFASEWAAAGAKVVERLEASDGALRHVQNHIVSATNPLAMGRDSQIDGAEEYWFEAEAAARRFFAGPDGHGLQNRGALDLASCYELSGVVHPIWDGVPEALPKAVKIFPCGVRREGMSVADYRHHWIHVHGPLAMASPDGKDNLQRVEYCPADDLSVTGLPVGPYDGTGGIWVSDFELLSSNMRSEYYDTVLAPDELRFSDKQRSFGAVVREALVWGSYRRELAAP